MIKHIVMWKLCEQSKAQNTIKIKELFAGLDKEITQIKFLSVSEDVGIDGNFDMVLVTEFNSVEDLKAYQEHPTHKKISQFIKSVRTDRSCVDYEF